MIPCPSNVFKYRAYHDITIEKRGRYRASESGTGAQHITVSAELADGIAVSFHYVYRASRVEHVLGDGFMAVTKRLLWSQRQEWDRSVFFVL